MEDIRVRKQEPISKEEGATKQVYPTGQAAQGDVQPIRVLARPTWLRL